MIYTIKKKLQFLFKKLSYGVFKLFYGEITGIASPAKDPKNKILTSQLDDEFSYKVYFINRSRIYTDTINDTAVIQNNRIIEGPSFQIRNSNFENIKKNVVFDIGTPRLKKKINGNLASLLTGGAGNDNYWHWLFDVLPRIQIIKNVFEIKNIDYFLFPSLKKRFQSETLNLISIPVQKRLFSTKYRHIECDEIIVTEHPYVINNDASNEIQNLPLWIIKWLKHSLTKDLNLKDNNFPKKIYIDRSDASKSVKIYRKIVNENEVVNTIENFGYKKITLSNHNFIDQMKYFFNARKIIGLHGAGFANMIFSNPNSNVLELKPSNAGDVIKNLANKCYLNYNCISVVPEKFNLNNQLGHITIAINELKKYL